MVSGLDLKSEPDREGAVVDLFFPEAVSRLDLKSEPSLQGAVVELGILDAESERDLRGAVVESFLAFLLLLVRSTELGIAAMTMEPSLVSGSSSPRSAETELVGRGGVGGSWAELLADLQASREP